MHFQNIRVRRYLQERIFALIIKKKLLGDGANGKNMKELTVQWEDRKHRFDDYFDVNVSTILCNEFEDTGETGIRMKKKKLRSEFSFEGSVIFSAIFHIERIVTYDGS
jgi:hypothetical protein